MTLKTLHLTNAWHATSSGLGTFYRSLLEAADESGHRLRLMVPSACDRVEQAGRHGRIYHLKSSRAPRNRSYRFLYPPYYLNPQGKFAKSYGMKNRTWWRFATSTRSRTSEALRKLRHFRPSQPERAVRHRAARGHGFRSSARRSGRGRIASYSNSANARLASSDPLSFADAVRQVNADSVLKSQKLDAALRTAAAYDWPIIAGRFLHLYGVLVDAFQTYRNPKEALYFYSTSGDQWGREL